MKAVYEEKESLLTRIKHFMWWCAGGDLATLKVCPTDHAKYTAMGMMMLAVPSVATVSFTFFVGQSFGLGSFVAALCGGAWGLLIFILDRLILTFHRKDKREKLRALPRLLLAVCLALVIGDPILLSFFHSEIELQMRRQGQMLVTEARGNAEARFRAETEALQKSNAEMQQRLDGLQRARVEREAAVIGEIEGRVGSRVKGEGPAARQKQQALDESKGEYERARTELLPRIDENKKQLERIRAEVEREVQAVADAQRAAKGPLARHAALFAILKDEPSTALTYVPLFFILLLTEISPLVVKLTTEPGEYDRRLRLKEENGVKRAEREMLFEHETQERFADTQQKMIERILEAVGVGRISALEEREREVAKLFQAITLEKVRRELLAQVPAPDRAREFDGEISIEVVGRPDLRISLQPPFEMGAKLTLEELAGDLEKIGAEVATDAGQAVELVKATASSGREVSEALPLLPQLDADQKLRLLFAPLSAPVSELPLA